MNTLKNMNTLEKLIQVGTLSSLLLFSGCVTTEDKNNNEKTDTLSSNTSSQDVPYPLVKIVKATQQSLAPKITLSGTITTKEEITIASEVTGTVQKVLKKEGDKISEGGIIMSLEPQTNLLRASHSSARVALQNAKKGLSLAKKSAQQNIKDADLQIKNATLALNNAQIAYDRLKNSETFKKESNSATKKNSDKILEITEKNLEIAKKSLEDLKEIGIQTNVTFADSIANVVSSSLISFRSHLNFIDSLVGASEFREHDNDSFEVYLSGASGNLIQKIQIDWRSFSHDLELLDAHFSEISKTKYSESDKDILLPVLENTLEQAELMKNILRDMENMLKKSISSVSFPETRISELKAQVQNTQSALEERISALKNLRQSITDFKIQHSQQIADAELAIALRESEVLAQESQNIVAKNSQGITEVNINSELVAAENALLNAKNAVEFAKSQKVSISIQGELAIQSALAQMDASQSLLDQAALSLSKLTIKSGINGTISKVLAFAGDTVSPGTPLMIISDYSDLKLVSDISLEESFLVKKGMNAEVSIDGINKKFIGTVSVIYPEADKITRRVRIEILIPNKEKIPANVFATATIQLRKEKPKIYIPSELLVSQNPASVMTLVRKKCTKVETIEENCIKSYQNKPLYVLQKQELVLQGNEETQFGLPVESGLRKNQYILKDKSNGLYEGDIVLLQKDIVTNENTDNTEDKNIKKINEEEQKEEQKNDTKNSTKEIIRI